MKVTVAGFDMDMEVEDDAVVTDVIVLARVQRPEDGDSTLTAARTGGTDYFVRLGMLHGALDEMRAATHLPGGDE